MGKIIDLNKTIYELSKEVPEITEIMLELGFKDIAKPGMLNTAGRLMTLKKGAAMKKIEMEVIVKTLGEKGYEIRE